MCGRISVDFLPHDNNFLASLFCCACTLLLWVAQAHRVFGLDSRSGVAFLFDSHPDPLHRYTCNKLVQFRNLHSHWMIYLCFLLKSWELCLHLGPQFHQPYSICWFKSGKISFGLVPTWHTVLLCCCCCVHMPCLTSQAILCFIAAISCLCSVGYVPCRYGVSVVLCIV